MHILATLLHLITGRFGQAIWEIHLIDFLPKAFVSSFDN
jgi:hypothetical protein